MEATQGERAQVAREVKDEAINQAHDLKSATAEHAGAMTNEAKAKAVDVAHDVKHELVKHGDAQAERVAGALHATGRQLEVMADGGEPGTVADVTRQLGGAAQQLAGRLESGGVNGVADDLRGFARRQPGLFLAAAGLAGFVVVRALRAAPSGAMSGGSSSGSPAQPAALTPMTPEAAISPVPAR
jgi:hypothetical protein